MQQFIDNHSKKIDTFYLAVFHENELLKDSNGTLIELPVKKRVLKVYSKKELSGM